MPPKSIKLINENKLDLFIEPHTQKKRERTQSNNNNKDMEENIQNNDNINLALMCISFESCLFYFSINYV